MAAQTMMVCGCSCNGITAHSAQSLSREKISSRSEFLGGQHGLVTLRRTGAVSVSSRRGSTMAIEAAISREKKEATVAKAKQQLEGAHLVAGIKYGGLTVKQLQTLRKALPESTTLLVAKNKLIGKAIEGTKWEALKPALKGMNAWLFVRSEEIPAAIKPYRDMQKELKLENEFTGAVFEGKFYAPEEFTELESMPTRAEIFSKILGSIQTPATDLVGTLHGPGRELIGTLRAYVAKLEEEAAHVPL